MEIPSLTRKIMIFALFAWMKLELSIVTRTTFSNCKFSAKVPASVVKTANSLGAALSCMLSTCSVVFVKSCVVFTKAGYCV